jgi:single-stranded DNA-binding protein
MAKVTVTINGTLAKDGKMKFTPSGVPVMEFSIPVQVSWGDDPKTDWWKVAVFGKMLEDKPKYAEMFRKGAHVIIRDAKPSIQIWDKDGKPQLSMGVSCNTQDVDFGYIPKKESSGSDDEDM